MAGSAVAAPEYPAQALPLDALTPGSVNPAVTQDNLQKTICRPKWVKNARPPTSYIDRVKELHVKRSDLADKKLKNYVADFRIPLEVGGGTDPGNIWAQPVGAGWSAGLGIIRQSASFATISNAVTLPAFTRADGAVYYRFGDRKSRLALNVENLFDRKYFATADNDNNISPGAPRNVRLTYSTTF